MIRLKDTYSKRRNRRLTRIHSVMRTADAVMYKRDSDGHYEVFKPEVYENTEHYPMLEDISNYYLVTDNVHKAIEYLDELSKVIDSIKKEEDNSSVWIDDLPEITGENIIDPTITRSATVEIPGINSETFTFSTGSSIGDSPSIDYNNERTTLSEEDMEWLTERLRDRSQVETEDRSDQIPF